VRWGSVGAVVVRSLKLLRREGARLFFSVVLPLLMLILLVGAFAPSERGGGAAVSIRVAVVPEGGAEGAAEEVAKYLRGSGGGAGLRLNVSATVVGNLTEALEGLRRGDLDAVIWVPAERGRNATLYLLQGTPDPLREQLVASYLRSFFEIGAKYEALALLSSFVNSTASALPQLEAAAREAVRRAWEVAANPRVSVVAVTPGRAGARELTIGWMTLSVVFISFMFGGVVEGAHSVVQEVRHGFLERLLSTGLTPSEYFAGLTLSWLASSLLSALPTLALGAALGGRLAVPLLSWEALLVALLTLAASLLTFSLGILIGILARSPEAASLAAYVLVFATQILGGFWVPKWMLPEPLRAFAEVNPLSVLFYGAAQVAFLRRPPSEYLAPVAASAAASVALFALAAALYARLMPKALEGG